MRQDGGAWTPAVRLRRGRVTVLADAADATLARAVLRESARDDFPGLARATAPVEIRIAPTAARFRDWVGASVPEWGAAVAVPAQGLIVLQGSRAGSDAGDPVVTLRHELAHLALHEALGDLAPRWFDEGYASVAAGEGARAEVLGTNAALVWRALPGLDDLDRWFSGGGAQAQAAYALSHLAVEELASLDPVRGLTVLLREWRATGRLDGAVRRAYGMTLAAVEARWQRRVRWRYGWLALAADLGVVASATALLLVPLWVSRRRRDRARLDAMKVAEAQQEAAARASALAGLLGEAQGGAGGGEAPREHPPAH